MPDPNVHIFGIRHHGPGSARSLVAALKKLKPDCLLVEGPPDADDLITLGGHKEMKPPVAILIYAAADPQKAVYYPFAEFSPEWQAVQYALGSQIPVRFCDLPQTHQLALTEPRAGAQADVAADEPADTGPRVTAASALPAPVAEIEPTPAVRHDPLGALAAAAGYSDGERWWEYVVESRFGGDDVFPYVLEAMSELRRGDTAAPERREELREAWMRQTIREASRQGHKNIAVVCGAWHAPALASMPPARDDAAVLKGMAKIKVQATWVPWSYSRLTSFSGYGAGIRSPGYYEHLWKWHNRATLRWMTRAARLFREEDIDCSSAHVIEAVRLAETLAAFRRLVLPGLPELNDAARSVFCFDTDLPMQLISRKLIVGDRLGAVPDEAPTVPLQQDIQKQQKRLRLPPEELEKALDLDLRKENDQDRSRLLHRLNVLGIPWGVFQGAGNTKGTFHEIWKLRWEVEYVVRIAEMGIWGNTVPQAASAFARHRADASDDLPTLCKLVDAVLLADLTDAIAHLMHRLQQQAAIASDISHLMDALPPLANVLRYGNVRQTDTSMVDHVVTGLVARICIGLPPACASLNDDAAAEMVKRLMAVHAAIPLLQNQDHAAAWHSTLQHLADTPSLHGLLAGRCTRLLLDVGSLPRDTVATAMSLALSPGNDPALAAAWIEGFLYGSGIVLLHDEDLWKTLDDWVTRLHPDSFTQMLPILRRTFSTFAPPERRQMGQRVKENSDPGAARQSDSDLDPARAQAVLPVLKQILGIS